MAGKYFELLDFPKFAYPSILGMDEAQTAINLLDRLDGAAFMSYGQIWPRMSQIVSGEADDAFIEREFQAYKDNWKNQTIRHVVRELRDYFKGRGRWYPVSTKPLRLAGFWFKPSIKGIWFVDGRAYAVSINARKNQRLFPDHIAFLARGIYELHSIEDPNDPIPLIIDVSEHEKEEGRKLRAYVVHPEEAISANDFNEAARSFLKALKLAGVPLPLLDAEGVISLLKRR